MFRCPGCSTWWRTSAGGNLVKTVPPGIEVEVVSDTERSKHRVPVTTAVAATGSVAGSGSGGQASRLPPRESAVAATGPVAGSAAVAATGPVAGSAGQARPLAARAPAKKPKPAPPPQATQREGPLRYAALWIATAAKTKVGRWVIALSLLNVLWLVPILFPSLFPSQLKSRGQKAATAWLAGDVEGIKSFVDPSQAQIVDAWMKEHPPPDLSGQQPAPKVNVAVQRNDGRTAEVLIQVKAKKTDGAPVYFVFRHRWISRNGVWYIVPGISAARASAGRPGG
jgi:hypothetical protein